MHVDVITISWFHTCSIDPNDEYDAIEIAAIKEILDNGTIIVASAGNGSMHCNGGPIYPFSPLVDPRIICVSSTGIDDMHYNIGGTHSGYPAVSICAPGYGVMGAVPSVNADGSASVWPYYGSCTGTSFATPIVAGVCALMKSVNPFLTPVKAKSIIQATADPIVDAGSYPNQVGAGRINAYKAVLGACNTCGGLYNPYFIMSNTTISQNNTYKACKYYLSNVTILNNSQVTLDKGSEISIDGTFEVQSGSTLEVK